jgi:hypothetical protein
VEQPKVKHPDYPVRDGDPEMDRCVCGGVRHWHAADGIGCDDCGCLAFVLAKQEMAKL